MMVDKIIAAQIPVSGAPSPASPADRLAAYLRDLASRGMGCATNNDTIAGVLGMTGHTVRAAKTELIRAKRLTGDHGKWFAIDGLAFGKRVTDELEDLKIRLRKYFPLVVDARTLDKPDRVALGAPAELIVGTKRMSLRDAIVLANSLDGKP